MSLSRSPELSRHAQLDRRNASRIFVMGSARFRVAIATAVTILIIVAGLVASQLPAIGAGGLLHPARRSMVEPLPDICEDVPFKGAEVDLKGWHCRGAGVRRGTLVYLHGIADNRGSAAGIVRRFAQRGFDVIAYGSPRTWRVRRQRVYLRLLRKAGPSTRPRHD